MNRYRHAVAEMDARRHWRMRVLTLSAAAMVIALALWGANAQFGVFGSGGWWQGIKDWWAQDWFPERDPKQAIPPQLPAPVVTQNPGSLPAVLPGTDSSASKVPLPLILVRTELGRNAREGRAFMGTAPDNPQTYTAGAILANGARIAEIYNDHIVLERDGKRSKLYIDGKKNGKSASDLLTVGGQPQQIKPAVATYRDVLTDYIRPSPVYEGDRIKGYQVYPGQRGGIFSQLGLQNGDVILALNDQPFFDPQQAQASFKQLTDGQALVATVERKGKVERISLDGQLVAADQERLRNPPPSLPLSAHAP
jgi:hypothetical protein